MIHELKNLKFKKFYFSPYGILMGFVWISKQAALI